MNARTAVITCLVLLIPRVVALHAGEASYTLKEGETLYGIAKKAQIPVEVLRAFNKIDDPSKLKPGTLIRVPSAYTVKKGDTLFSIARASLIPLRDLLATNKLTDTSLIKPGDKLYLPGKKEGEVAAHLRGKGASQR